MNQRIIFAVAGAVAVAAGVAVALVIDLPGGGEPAPTQEAARPPAADPPVRPDARTPTQPAEARRQDFADWVLICPGGGQACMIVQNHVEPDSERTVFGIQLRRAGGKVDAVLVTPLLVRLPPGVALAVGGGEPLRIAFSRCVGELCQAPTRLDDNFIKRLLAAPAAQASFEMVGGQTVSIEISLDGFAEAFAALEPETGN